MGSFDKICGITGMTIRGGEPCYVTRLERQQHVYRYGPSIMEPDQDLVQGILYDHNPFRHSYETDEEYYNLAIEKEARKMEKLVWRKYCHGNK